MHGTQAWYGAQERHEGTTNLHGTQARHARTVRTVRTERHARNGRHGTHGMHSTAGTAPTHARKARHARKAWHARMHAHSLAYSHARHAWHARHGTVLTCTALRVCHALHGGMSLPGTTHTFLQVLTCSDARCWLFIRPGAWHVRVPANHFLFVYQVGRTCITCGHWRAEQFALGVIPHHRYVNPILNPTL